jgi:prepilin-type processing-associated H-X9-DG protein
LFRTTYQNLKILQCPSEVSTVPPGPLTDTNAPNTSDSAPRSYIINGWNDFYGLTNSNRSTPVPESAIRLPTDTIIFGEKNYDSAHFFMDFADLDDVRQLDQSKHSSGRQDANGNGGGGSNYAYADGSVRYSKFGRTLNPINLWAVMPDIRAAGY